VAQLRRKGPPDAEVDRAGEEAANREQNPWVPSAQEGLTSVFEMGTGGYPTTTVLMREDIMKV
jgi:hypothetical protein